MEFKKGIYKHYKGKIYKAIGVARHSETLEELVVYINVKDEADMWVRPKGMFLEKINKDEKLIDRFTFIQKL